MSEGAGGVAPWAERGETISEYGNRPLVAQCNRRDDIGTVRDLLERGYAFRALAKAIQPTRSFGCIPLIELEAA